MFEANVHFLNVGHGDSIIIEFLKDDKSFYCVIDSNSVKKNGKWVNRSFEFLKQRNVKNIEALMITHYHKDHILGVEDILNNFTIEKISLPPIYSKNYSSFSSLIYNAKGYIRSLKNSKDEEVRNYCKSFASLLKEIVNNPNVFDEIGPKNEYSLKNVGKIGYVLLPVNKVIGEIQQQLEHPDKDIQSYCEMNKLSLVLQLQICGHNILLTGDSTYDQWFEHQRRSRNGVILTEKSCVVKAAHHGSKKDNNKDLFNYWFDLNSEKHLIISANGLSHPFKEVFELGNVLGIQPHCTNLSKHCMPEIREFVKVDGYFKNAWEFISVYGIEQPEIECQGDITVNIRKGSLSISWSSGLPCIYKPILISGLNNEA